MATVPQAKGCTIGGASASPPSRSIALIPLTLLFIFPFGRTLGGGHDAFVATYSNLWHALVAVLFIIAAFAHLQQGLQTVIEDYALPRCWSTCCCAGRLARLAFCRLPPSCSAPEETRCLLIRSKNIPMMSLWSAQAAQVCAPRWAWRNRG